MNLLEQFQRDIRRRTFLGQTAAGLGAVALSSLMRPAAYAAKKTGALDEKWKGIVSPAHHPAKAKRVIFLTMAGGPSHLETWDFKTKLQEMNGKKMPESFTKGQPIAQLQNQKLSCYGPQVPFATYGKSGHHFSSLFPNIGKVADELCIIRSMHTEQINHDPAHTFMNTGTSISGRPSMGSWTTYGLGSECENLPGFVVLISLGKGGQAQPVSSRQWSSGFLPSNFQGVHFQSKGDPVLYVKSPPGVSEMDQEQLVHSVNSLNTIFHKQSQDPEILTRVNQYEMAFKMQSSVPGLMDVSKEPKEVMDLYGATPGDGSFASNCLLARRLAERGVRFIQLYHRDWDHHGDIKKNMEITCKEVDQGCYALITDLKQRGMLDDTIIVWAGEFGRTPMAQGDGRDHHIRGYSIWMAGGGIKGGISYGNTDELGYKAEENPFHVHDLHATMMHLLGVDHKKLTYRFQGRDFRLTDVHGNVVKQILA